MTLIPCNLNRTSALPKMMNLFPLGISINQYIHWSINPQKKGLFHWNCLGPEDFCEQPGFGCLPPSSSSDLVDRRGHRNPDDGVQHLIFSIGASSGDAPKDGMISRRDLERKHWSVNYGDLKIEENQEGWMYLVSVDRWDEGWRMMKAVLCYPRIHYIIDYWGFRHLSILKAGIIIMLYHAITVTIHCQS